MHTPYEYLKSDDLILHYGELYNYFIIYHSVIIREVKYTTNVMHLNHPQTIPASPHPAQSVEKFPSMTLVPGANKVGDHWCKSWETSEEAL